MKKIILSAAVVAMSLLNVMGAAVKPVAEFWISPKGDDKAAGTKAAPVKTLKAALRQVRNVEKEGEKVIIFKDGFYSFEEPVTILSTDYDLTIRAEHKGKAVLSGAVELKGWRKDEEDERFLVTELPFEPKAGDGLVLICNGKWCEIAEFPQKGRLQYKANGSSRVMNYDEKSLPDGMSFEGIDLASAWLIIPQEWATTRTLIREMDLEAKTLTLASKTGMPMGQYNQGFKLFNTRHGLTERGKWMFEATGRKVVYWPREGESAANLKASLSRVENIIDMQSASGVKIEGLVFEGCLMRAENNNIWAARGANAPISAKNSRNILIEDVEIRNTAEDGVFMLKPVNSFVRRSHIHDVGSAAVNYADGGNGSGVEWSHVHDFGRSSMNANGIGLQLNRPMCVGNVIHDGPGNGVTMWNSNGGGEFASNEIYRVMKVQRDGGGLYGGYVDMVIRDNYVHDMGGWVGLYADEGSQRVVFTRNRFENCWWPMHAHCSQFIVVTNNVFKNSGGMRFSFQNSGHNTFSDNKIYTKEMIKSDPYVNNCDEWARNEVFLEQADGTYKSAGKVTLEREKGAAKTWGLNYIQGSYTLPINDRGEVNYRAFPMKWNTCPYTDFGMDGYPVLGVPNSQVKLAYDDCYLYVGFSRNYNALCGYLGMQNFTSRGWKHCDAARVVFENGSVLTVYPTGDFETSGKDLQLEKGDVKVATGGKIVVVRIPLEHLDIAGAKKGGVNLESGMGGDDMVLDDMMTDEATEESAAGQGKARTIMNVLGCKLKFNAMIWVEDLREVKCIAAPDGKNLAMGTIEFTGKKPKK